MAGQVWNNLCVQIFFPIHTLGNGFNDQIAFTQARQMLLIVNGFNKLQVIGVCQGCGFLLLKSAQRLLHNAALVSLRSGQVKQKHFHVGAGQMSRNLSPHGAGPKHGCFFYDQSFHCQSPINIDCCQKISSQG